MTKIYVKTDYVPAGCDYLTVGKVYEGFRDEEFETANIKTDDKDYMATIWIGGGRGCSHIGHYRWNIVTEQEYLEQDKAHRAMLRDSSCESVKSEADLSEIKEAIAYSVKKAFDEVGLEGFKKTSLFMSNRNKEDQLTIRDRFAIAASERDIDNYIMWNSATCREEARYMFADAMLKERNK